MGRRGRGQADLDGIEVIEDEAPRRKFARSVPPVTFVGDDAIEGVNRDVEFIPFVVPFVVTFLDAGNTFGDPLGVGTWDPLGLRWASKKKTSSGFAGSARLTTEIPPGFWAFVPQTPTKAYSIPVSSV